MKNATLSSLGKRNGTPDLSTTIGSHEKSKIKLKNTMAHLDDITLNQFWEEMQVWAVNLSAANIEDN